MTGTMKGRIEEHGDSATIIHTASLDDIKAVADNCAALRSIGHGNGEDKLAMSAPGFVIMEWCNRRGIEWSDFMRSDELAERFINDPDNKNFRIWEGRV